MTTVNGPLRVPEGPAQGRTTEADVPTRAAGTTLIGEMKGSGYREPPALARRGDGQTLQLTPLLYLVLSAVDGRRTTDEISAVVSRSHGRTVSPENVRTLLDEQLRAFGLVTRPDGSQPEVRKSNPLLGLRFKYAVTDPERTRRITTPFGWLFNPVVVVLVLAALVAVSWWVLFHKGLASATHEAFDKPGLLVLVVAVTVLSAGFHEFGHAAAARRGGAVPGAMGAGIYLVWPAFYTDVTDSYRLGRRGRVLTDLGGLYFNAIVAVVMAGIWWVSRYDALLLVIATQILQMVRQLTPLVRFDGYHVLADVTGVPDLFQRIRPTLLGVLPWRWRHPESTVLKPWARAVVTVWVLAVVPLLAFSLFCMVVALPRILGTAWAGAGKQGELLQAAWGDGDVLAVLGRGIALVAVTFPVLATALIVTRLVRSLVGRTWAATSGRPLRRAIAGAVALCLVGGLAYAWWPRDGTYRPIQPYEGGTLTQVAAAARPAAASAGLRAGDHGRITTGWADGDPRPTRQDPQLALVLVPRGGTTTSTTPTKSAGGGTSAPQPWVFPFDKPLKPGKGDNQAMSVNTTDNTIRYDVAFALVWIEDDSPALNTNEAYAFASCKNCAAVAVGFQVVLVTGENHVAVPQNISAAVNNNCVNCLTYALATQLFVTVDGPLADASMKQLEALWKEIAAFGADIASVPLDQIKDRLTAYETKILDIIHADEAAADPAGPAEAGQPDEGAAPSGDPSPAAEGSGSEDGGANNGTTDQAGTDQDSTDSGTDTEPAQEGDVATDPAPADPAPTPGAEPSANP